MAADHHFPTGPWYQPDKIFAGHCECGVPFQGATLREAQEAWLLHYRAAIVVDPKADCVCGDCEPDNPIFCKGYTSIELPTAKSS